MKTPLPKGKKAICIYTTESWYQAVGRTSRSLGVSISSYIVSTVEADIRKRMASTAASETPQ